MATTIALQLTTISQETFTANPDRTAGTNTPVNANQAQAGTPPEDTVTLSPQSGQTQLSGQNEQQNQQQPPAPSVEIFVAEAVVFGPLNPSSDNAATQNQASQTAAPPGTTPQNAASQAEAQDPNTVATPQVNVPTTVQTAAPSGQTAPSASAPTSQQQELAQLDQALQQLGLNPDTIGLFNQLAMLAYINDPAALEAFVQTLTDAASQVAPAGGVPSAISTPAGAATAAAANSSAPATTASTASQNPAPAAQSSAQNAQSSDQPTQGAAVLAEVVITELPPPRQTNANNSHEGADQNRTDAAANSNAPVPNNGLVVQFQELQLAFAVGAGSGNAAGSSGNGGSAINITI